MSFNEYISIIYKIIGSHYDQDNDVVDSMIFEELYDCLKSIKHINIQNDEKETLLLHCYKNFIDLHNEENRKNEEEKNIYNYIIEELLKLKADPNIVDSTGHNIIMYTILDNNYNIFDLIIKYCVVNYNVKNNDGETLLTLCIKKNRDFLYDHKILIEKCVDIQNNKNEYPLLLVKRDEQLSLLFFEYANNYNIVDSDNNTLLMWYAQYNYKEFIDMIIHTVDCDIINSSGMTALTMSLDKKEGEECIECIKIILHYSDLNKVNIKDVITLLVRHKNFNVIRYLFTNESIKEYIKIFFEADKANRIEYYTGILKDPLIGVQKDLSKEIDMLTIKIIDINKTIEQTKQNKLKLQKILETLKTGSEINISKIITHFKNSKENIEHSTSKKISDLTTDIDINEQKIKKMRITKRLLSQKYEQNDFLIKLHIRKEELITQTNQGGKIYFIPKFLIDLFDMCYEGCSDEDYNKTVKTIQTIEVLANQETDTKIKYDDYMNKYLKYKHKYLKLKHKYF